MKTTDIKMGVYRAGSHVKIISEMDLITQYNGSKDEGIYLSDVTYIKNPNDEITSTELKKIKVSIVGNFKKQNFDFKAKNRGEAAIFTASKVTSKWLEVVPFELIKQKVM